MEWLPNTHKISFMFDLDGEEYTCASFETQIEKYLGRDAQEVFDEVLAEHRAINQA